MIVQFVGEPRELGASGRFAIDVEADGRTLECVISDEAVSEVAGDGGRGTDTVAQGFRDGEQVFRDVVAAKLGRTAHMPDRVSIHTADVLRDGPAP